VRLIAQNFCLSLFFSIDYRLGVLESTGGIRFYVIGSSMGRVKEAGASFCRKVYVVPKALVASLWTIETAAQCIMDLLLLLWGQSLDGMIDVMGSHERFRILSLLPDINRYPMWAGSNKTPSCPRRMIDKGGGIRLCPSLRRFQHSFVRGPMSGCRARLLRITHVTCSSKIRQQYLCSLYLAWIKCF
jgi:hypothetical protein